MAQIAEPRRFPESRLPAKTYDGSHLSWTAYRWNVLAPYRIRILDSVPEERSPQDVIDVAESHDNDVSRFDAQSAQFKAQVPLGRGFGPSPIFPPNLLPQIKGEDGLTRCMIPQCSREALPERAKGQQGSMYELPLPRPGMVSGYTLETFTVTERVELPQSLTPTGTIVHYDTGYVTPGAVAVAPFFTFERTKGTAEDELEGAMNRCALNGAWCVRSLQLMYNKAYQGFMIPQLPTAFSCVIDNTLAIINYHWIDHGEEYYMANLRRFDFNEEGACSRFQAFVQAIERWALDKQLPRVKAGVEKLSFQLNTPPMTPDNSQAEPTIHYDRTGSESIFKALKTTFSNVPWRMEEDDRTPMPPSAMRSPLDTRTRTSIFDFSYDDVSQRASVAHYSSPRGHRRTESNLSDGSTVTSPLSPASFKRPHLGHSSRPSVPVIRLPASPKDRQTSPSSPAPPQWQQQLMSLSQEVQSLRKELQELKMSYPASPGVVSSAVGEHNHGEVGLAPIPEEIPSPANDMVVTVSTLPVSPSKRELTLTVTEISAETPSEDNFKHGSKHSRSSSSTVTPNTPVVEHDRGVLDNFIQRVRTKLSELSFWQIATSVYLTVLLGKLLVSAQHRDAVGCLVVP